MGQVSREIEILRNTQKEKLEIKNTAAEIKNALTGLLEDQIELVTTKVSPKKSPKLKHKEIKG